MKIRFRLWQLFALLALVALVLWVCQHLDVAGIFSTRRGTGHFWVDWKGERIWHFQVGE